MSTINFLPVQGRPHLAPVAIEALLAPYAIDSSRNPLIIIGVRGFFAAMGSTPGNDRNIYDDAIFLYAPSLGICAGYNGNTDPSKYRPGYGFDDKTKGMATLMPGAWPVYRFALHRNQYEALCQKAGTVTVTRDGNPPYADTGYFGINIHKGGNFTSTGSEGCQTIYGGQWEEFIGTAHRAALQLFGQGWRDQVLYYVLVDSENGLATNQPVLALAPPDQAPQFVPRVEHFRRDTIAPTLRLIGSWSESAEALLLGTALVESGLQATRQHGGGPALGYFQMEPATHDDLWRYLESRRPTLGATLRNIAGQSGQPPAETMINNAAYACAMARVHYMRIPEKIPPANDINGLAAYWKRYYNTPNGAGTVEKYKAAWLAAYETKTSQNGHSQPGT